MRQSLCPDRSQGVEYNSDDHMKKKGLSYIPVLRALLICTLLLLVYGASAQHHVSTCTIRGKVTDMAGKEGIGFASVLLADQAYGVACDGKGEFVIKRVTAGSYRVVVSCMGFASFETTLHIKADTTVYFRLKEHSIALKEVQVLATYKNKTDGNVSVDRTALEHIQPTSLRDIFLLLPGNVVQSNSLTGFVGTTSRQIGSDDNTSLGTNISIDGMPLSNDAMRTQLYGITGVDRSDLYVADRTVTRRTGMNAGIDLRTISTDHIETIEIERGISSVGEGNLSSGAIRIRTKQGSAPLQMRVKADPLSKLAYVGKGFKVSKRGASIHTGIDFLHNKPDVREVLDSYKRSTLHARYSDQLNYGDKIVDLGIGLMQTFSIQDSKSDQLVNEYEETYNSKYLRSSLSFDAKVRFSGSWLNSIDWLLSADYTSDLLKRKKYYISTSGPKSMPVATESGEHEGVFLPSAYYAYYEIDNQPLYFFSRFKANTDINFTERHHHHLLYGLEARSSKNIGRGVVADPTRPPYPGNNSYIRPRPNYNIPASVYAAFFVEDRASVEWGANRLGIQAGLRATHLFNLPSSYALSRKMLIEPRIKANWQYRAEHLSINLRAGYGMENKLPTLDHLYPDKIYRDFMVLNAYMQNPELDHLITYTYIHNPENPAIRENRNVKKEIGIDMTYKRFDFSLTLFHEESRRGFEYFDSYLPIAFDRYTKLIAPLPPGHKPQKEDYIQEHHKDFFVIPTVQNSAKVVKRGIEFRLRTPYLKAINTQVEVNGAYYHTLYASGIPIMFRPIVSEYEQAFYPYVGYYEGSLHKHYQRFNTNVWVNTHFPRYKLIFTSFFQIIWHDASYRGHEESEFPYAYMDLDGVVHPTSKAAILEAAATNDILKYLSRERTELYYRATYKPISLRINFKATKEFSDRMRLAFFVDNIIDINPKYKQANNTTERDWSIPYFGIETTFTL